MSDAKLQTLIEQAFEDRAEISPQTTGDVRDAVERALRPARQRQGARRGEDSRRDGAGVVEGQPVAEEGGAAVVPPQRQCGRSPAGPAARPGGTRSRRSSPAGAQARFRAAGFRAVPGAVVRRSAYIAPDAVLMPCFVNLGAYVDAEAPWSTPGSRSAPARRSARTCISPAASASAACSSRCRPTRPSSRTIASSARARKWSRASSSARARCCRWACSSRASTKIVDRATGKVHVGYVPPYSVVVSGTLPGKPLPDGSPGPSLYCAVIVKTVDAQTRAKTGINELLRD